MRRPRAEPPSQGSFTIFIGLATGLLHLDFCLPYLCKSSAERSQASGAALLSEIRWLVLHSCSAPAGLLLLHQPCTTVSSSAKKDHTTTVENGGARSIRSDTLVGFEGKLAGSSDSYPILFTDLSSLMLTIFLSNANPTAQLHADISTLFLPPFSRYTRTRPTSAIHFTLLVGGASKQKFAR